MALLLGVAVSSDPAAAEEAYDEPDLAVTVEGAIDAPFDAVRAVLLDVAGLGAWFPGVDEWLVLETGEDTVLVYGSQALPWPISDRDYVVRYRWAAPRRAVFRLEAQSDVSPSAPVRKGRIRVDDMRTVWTLTSRGEGAHVRYTYEGGTGMPLPGWVARAGWRRRASDVVDALRAEVARRSAAAASAEATYAPHETGDPS